MMDFLNGIIAFEKEINLFTVALRIVLSALFGAIIGIERARHGSQAGMRTHILVCLGGAMTSLLGVYCTQILGFSTDPLRVSAQVVSGIGFLGAGMIIVKSEKVITGLTTAAIMWSTAIIGIAVGVGFYSGALIAALVCVFTAAVLDFQERKKKKSVCVYVEVGDISRVTEITDEIKSLARADAQIELTPAKSGTAGNVGLVVILSSSEDVNSFKNSAKEIKGVCFALAS